MATQDHDKGLGLHLLCAITVIVAMGTLLPESILYKLLSLNI